MLGGGDDRPSGDMHHAHGVLDGDLLGPGGPQVRLGPAETREAERLLTGDHVRAVEWVGIWTVRRQLRRARSVRSVSGAALTKLPPNATPAAGRGRTMPSTAERACGPDLMTDGSGPAHGAGLPPVRDNAS